MGVVPEALVVVELVGVDGDGARVAEVEAVLSLREPAGGPASVRRRVAFGGPDPVLLLVRPAEDVDADALDGAAAGRSHDTACATSVLQHGIDVVGVLVLCEPDWVRLVETAFHLVRPPLGRVAAERVGEPDLVPARSRSRHGIGTLGVREVHAEPHVGGRAVGRAPDVDLSIVDGHDVLVLDDAAHAAHGEGRRDEDGAGDQHQEQQNGTTHGATIRAAREGMDERCRGLATGRVAHGRPPPRCRPSAALAPVTRRPPRGSSPHYRLARHRKHRHGACLSGASGSLVARRDYGFDAGARIPSAPRDAPAERAAGAARRRYSSTSWASCGGTTPRLARRRETFCGTSWMKQSS